MRPDESTPAALLCSALLCTLSVVRRRLSIRTTIEKTHGGQSRGHRKVASRALKQRIPALSSLILVQHPGTLCINTDTALGVQLRPVSMSASLSGTSP